MTYARPREFGMAAYGMYDAHAPFNIANPKVQRVTHGGGYWGLDVLRGGTTFMTGKAFGVCLAASVRYHHTACAFEVWVCLARRGVVVANLDYLA